ncbi:MAG: hypothetical protein ACLFV7_03150 [Phycisphaerae bacterium]
MTRTERLRRSVWGAILLAAVFAGGCPRTRIETQPAPAPTALPDPSEDDEFAQLLLEKPDLDVLKGRRIEQDDEEDDPNAAARRRLPVAGSQIIDQPVELQPPQHANWWVVDLKPLQDPNAATGARRVLPSRLLEKMEIVHARNADMTFHVSGETTLYHGNAYVLLRKAVVYRRQTPQPRKQAQPAPQPQPTEDANAPATTTQPAEPTTQPASPEDIMDVLLKDKPARPVRLPDVEKPRNDETESVAPVIKREDLTAEQGFVVNRRVFISPEEGTGWWAARFIADNTLQERPVRLLPNRLLERAEDLARSGRDRGVEFIVSGEVTHYKGKRYLLLRKLLVRRDMGQF